MQLIRQLRIVFPILAVSISVQTGNSAELYGSAPQPGPTPPFRWPQGKKAALSLSFDYAWFSQQDVGLPLAYPCGQILVASSMQQQQPRSSRRPAYLDPTQP